MIYKTTDNQDLYYEISGNIRSGKQLVFLNGLSQTTLAWGLLLPAFEKDYKIILCDFIFQGQSDKKGDWRTFDQHAEDISGLLKSISKKPSTIIGISYGSLVAQHLALNHPETIDKLILLSTFAHKTPYFEAIELAWMGALDSGGYPLLLDVMLPTVLGESYFNNPLIPLFNLKSSRAGINTDASALRKLMKATKERADFRQELQSVDKPPLIIHGEKDLLLPLHMARAVAQAIPGSRFEVIPGAGHTLNLEAAPQTTALILSFLNEHK
jgi:3-oxoadipate enol-lactonase